MQLETPYEFLGRQCQRCFPAAVPVLFQAKGDRPFFLVDVEDTVVADRYFMRVPSQIFDHVFRSSERRLGIDHPLFFEQIVILAISNRIASVSPSAKNIHFRLLEK